MRSFRMLFSALAALLCACATFDTKETTWLRKAEGQATQEEIRRQWGEPAAAGH